MDERKRLRPLSACPLAPPASSQEPRALPRERQAVEGEGRSSEATFHSLALLHGAPPGLLQGRPPDVDKVPVFVLPRGKQEDRFILIVAHDADDAI